MKQTAGFCLILTAILSLGCSQNPVDAPFSGHGPRVIVSGPRTLDDQCAEDFNISSIHFEIVSASTGQQIAAGDVPFTSDGDPVEISVPTDHPIILTVEGFAGTTPLLRGEFRGTLTESQVAPITLDMVPHPDWPGSSLTLVEQARNSGSPDYEIGLHVHVPASFNSFIWAVLCWDDDAIFIPTGFGDLPAATGWTVIPVVDAAIHDYFCNFDSLSTVAVIAVPSGAITTGFDGVVGSLNVQPRTSSAGALTIIDGGFGTIELLNTCVLPYINSGNPQALEDSIERVYGGYDSLLFELALIPNQPCLFDWNDSPEISGSAAVRGVVRDASTGLPIADASVAIGGFASTTNESGEYQFYPVSFDSYDAHVSREGFVPFDLEIVVDESEEVVAPILMSSIQSNVRFRIVLSWGPYPRDLDSYLLIPGFDCSVYYATVDHCQLGEPPYALIEHDEKSGYGPETTVIGNLFEFPCTYRVQRFQTGEGSLDISGATVRVFDQTQLRATFTVPQTPDILSWDVFEIDASGAIIPINSVSGELLQAGTACCQ